MRPQMDPKWIPKWIQRGSRSGSEMDPGMIQNDTGMEPEMDQRMSPKSDKIDPRKSSETICFPCVPAQNGAPEGAQKGLRK